MLAYAANRPAAAQRGSSPNAMLAIIAIHVAAVAALMSAKMDLPVPILDKPIDIDWIEPIQPPPPVPPADNPARPQPGPTVRPDPGPAPPLPNPFIPLGPTTPDPGPTVGPPPTPGLDPPSPLPLPARLSPRLLTPPSELKPPYPRTKLASGEEAVLRLNLTIDEHGRVVAVEPIGRADRVFLDAARRHLLAHWRYKPASEGGRSVGSTIAVTLRFELEA